ncbi:MAG: hypothetical protein IJ837_02750 [Clostridia bacterium]|nr:hypothetical protein [Clostridia bacterium]
MLKTKNLFLSGFLLALCFVLLFSFSGCGYVKCAWVQFKADDGKVVYTSDMYGNTGAHIYYYENDEKFENNDYAMTISFSPRILGADTRNGEETTTVDMSEKNIIFVTIYKSSTIYSNIKSIYLNDKKLTPDEGETTENDYTISMSFLDFKFNQGNPNGKENDVINVIEYK